MSRSRLGRRHVLLAWRRRRLLRTFVRWSDATVSKRALHHHRYAMNRLFCRLDDMKGGLERLCPGAALCG
jgi:hypothetical protein